MSSKLLKTQLTAAQNAAIDRLYETDETLLIARMGFGKAIVGLTALQELIADDVLSCVLVVAPLKVATLTWGKEPEKWDHITVPVHVLCGGKSWCKSFPDTNCIVVVNPENLPKLIDEFGDRFDGVLFDEMTKFKTSGGVRFRKLRSWVRGLKWRCGMTGTPVAESGLDIYGQALLLDLGKSLGTSKDRFCRSYFDDVSRSPDYQQWQIQDGAAEQIGHATRHLVFTADDKDYITSLPPVNDHIIYADMPEDGRRYYKALQDDFIAEVGDVAVVAENPGVVTQKLDQIASGGLYDNDGGLIWSDGYKLDMIPDLGTPLIIVYQYKFELDMLKEHYPDAPILGGGHTLSDTQFLAWDKGDIPVLILHPKSAAHGLNLQQSCYSICFTAPVASADNWQQSLARIHRRGQSHPWVDRYVIVTQDSHNKQVLDAQLVKAHNERALMSVF